MTTTPTIDAILRNLGVDVEDEIMRSYRLCDANSRTLKTVRCGSLQHAELIATGWNAGVEYGDDNDADRVTHIRYLDDDDEAVHIVR